MQTIRQMRVVRILSRDPQNATDRINKGFLSCDRFLDILETELFLPVMAMNTKIFHFGEGKRMGKAHRDELISVVRDILEFVPDESLAVVASFLRSFLKYYRREGKNQ